MVITVGVELAIRGILKALIKTPKFKLAATKPIDIQADTNKIKVKSKFFTLFPSPQPIAGSSIQPGIIIKAIVESPPVKPQYIT